MSDAPQPSGFMAWWRHAFAIEAYDESSLAPEERAQIDKLAAGVHRRGLASAAILWVHSNRHLGWLSSQALVAAAPVYDLAHPFLRPLLSALGMHIPPEELPLLAAAFEKRYAVEYFVRQLEALQGSELPAAAYNETAAEAEKVRDDSAPPKD